jgi:hypothetical protein
MGGGGTTRKGPAMAEESNGWIKGTHKQPTPGKLVFVLWAPPHYPVDVHVCSVGRWVISPRNQWEIFGVEKNNHTEPRVGWWREMLPLPAGIKIANS